MTVTLTDDEVRFFLHVLGGVQGNLAASDAIKTCRLVQGLAKKLQPPKAKPKPKSGKKGK